MKYYHIAAPWALQQLNSLYINLFMGCGELDIWGHLFLDKDLLQNPLSPRLIGRQRGRDEEQFSDTSSQVQTGWHKQGAEEYLMCSGFCFTKKHK